MYSVMMAGWINRIRLEFKLATLYSTTNECIFGLIESDWNLNVFIDRMGNLLSFVLIESDWNLNQKVAPLIVSEDDGINRIRLEFKC